MLIFNKIYMYCLYTGAALYNKVQSGLSHCIKSAGCHTSVIY